MNPELLSQVHDIWSLIALIILSIVYVITILYNRKQSKKQTKEVIKTFSEQNDKIITKIEDLRESRNTLDLQSSMDLISTISNKSMLKIMDGIRRIIEQNNIHAEERRNIIYSKIKNIVNSQYDDDMLILSRIYYKNIRLSFYIVDIKRFELTDAIFNKLMEDNDNKLNDIMDYIKSKYHQSIQSAQLQISS